MSLVLNRMKRNLTLLFFLICLNSFGQSGERFYFTFGPSVTVGNSFEGGALSISAPNITGTHHILPMFSPLWGYPNPEYSKMQNLGRKIHFAFQLEHFFNDKNAIVTGFELGGRGYLIRSELSSDYVVSYRNYNVPLYYSRSLWNGSFWSFRINPGFQFNYARSIPKNIDEVVIINKKSTFYPQVFLGLELIHRSFSAPFSFEVSYSHGNKNVIDHSYLALDYKNPVKIQSTGSAFRFTVKYLLYEKKHPVKVPELTIYRNKYDNLVFRNIKEPIRIKVPGDTLTICLSDDQTEDGDSVAIELNNRLVQKDILITKAGKCFTLVLEQGKPNTMIVHALNEGKIPPNTCVVTVIYGDLRKEIRLRSDLKNSGAIKFEH